MTRSSKSRTARIWGVRRRGDREEGAVLVIFAIAMVVLIGIVALAIDGSFGFVQNRRAQNAADFAAFAASQQLANSTYCNGSTQPSTAQIVAVVQQLVDDNDPAIGTAWKGQFVYSNHEAIPGTIHGSTFSPTATGGSPPPGACGVSVSASPQWHTFFAGVLGINHLSGSASGSVSESNKGNPIGIVALNQVGPHEILGGGTGTFLVSGDIVVNSDVSQQPWTSSSGGWEWDDAIDAKSNSDLYVYGTIHVPDATYNGEQLWPLDHCFQGAGIVGKGNPGAPAPSYQSGDPGAGLPAFQPACTVGSVVVAYDAIDPTISQITDPLAGSGAPPNPLNTTDAACPGMAAETVSSEPSTASVLKPAIYTSPVVLTGSATFEDCSGYAGEGAYPGVYVFQQGLWIDPQSSSDTITGSNIIIATQNPYPLAGNVPGTLNGTTFSATGSGNGAPCLPAGTTNYAGGGQSEVSTTACAGTNNGLYGAEAWGDASIQPDTSTVGTGDNFSLMIGGASGAQVNLTGPTTGPYAGTNGAPGIVLYQSPTDPSTGASLQANYGFDAQSGDAATINITGVVYNASLSNYGHNSPLDYWDGPGGGIPFYAGGTLQTGFGADWPTGPAKSEGSVTINGTAIVDDFNTDGATQITILGQPYTLPGGGSLSLIG